MLKQIIITGSTGFIGRILGKFFVENDYEVVGLTRSVKEFEQSEKSGVKLVLWDGCTAEGWAAYAEGAFAIINLAGENVGSGRWTKQKKQRILDSRLYAARAVKEAVKQAKQKPQVVVQASAIGYYGDSGDQILKEDAPAGAGFLADVCRQGEQAVQSVAEMGVRPVVIRIGLVLGPGGGMLARVVPMYRKFLGGCPGPGRNWLSWVHIQDIARAIKFLIEKPEIRGPFNLTAPHPVVAKEFYQLLGEIMHRPALMGAPAWVLKLLLGDMAGELLLAGQRALPDKLLEAGFQFQHPDLNPALLNVLTSTPEN